jgi:ribosomal-protein-alanine N-acetyltransferase
MKPSALPTKRLVLRRWTDGDREVLARITADPEVVRFRLRTLTRRESDDLIDTTESCFDRKGFGMWAAERAEDGRLIGYIGLEEASDDMPFRPLVHVGWHLAADVWGHGYATEGATAVLDYAFEDLGLAEVVAHTTARNDRSERVMRRLGMTHNPSDDFDAPWYPPGHPNRRFVLYRLNESEWRVRRAPATTTQNRSASEHAYGGREHS